MNHLEAMRVFVRVAELSSFTQAADSLGLPRASASTAVQQLEATLGTRLLHRTTRRVTTTHDGQAFLERSQDLLADMEALYGMFRRGGTLRGRLRVDMPSRIARRIVIPALPSFLDAHPELELELSTTDRRVDPVREGFDLVLRVGALADSGLVARTLGRLAQVNAASPAYLAARGTPRTLADLDQHRLVHYVGTLGARPAGFEHVDADGSTRTRRMAGVLTVNDTDAYEAACLAGLGLVQAPRLGLQGLIAGGRLVEVLPSHHAPPLPVSLVYAQRRHLPPRVQAMMDWLAALLRPHLDEGTG